MPPKLCKPPAISLLRTTQKKTVIWGVLNNTPASTCTKSEFFLFRAPLQPTGECFVSAASNGDQVLDDVLAVGGLATTALAQQNNRLILTSGQEVPVCSLGHAVNVRGSVLPSAALEHLHHLERG